LIENSDYDAFQPQIAMDSQGNAVVVWQQRAGTRASIWANRFNPASSSWVGPTLIENIDTGDAENPQVAMNGTNKAIVVWTQREGSGAGRIYSSRFTGTTWTVASPIQANDGVAGSPRIAAQENGRAVAAWVQWDGARSKVWSNRFDGAAWGTASMIATDDPGSMSNPDVAMAFNNTMVVWQSFNDSPFDIRGLVAGGSVSLESRDGNAIQPRVAVDQDKAIAVWSQTDGTRYSTWASRFDGDVWGGARLIETGDAGDALLPQVAMDGSGSAFAVWVQNDGSGKAVWFRQLE
jgi:hypothetical protein